MNPNYIGADGSYPEVAARAVANAAQQSPSPVYGYHRAGAQQKVYLFGTIADAHGWFAAIAQGQAQPYDYVAVFAATDLTRPVAGLESFGHTVVSGDAYVGNMLPFFLGLPLGALGGYFYGGWRERNPGKWIPGISGDPYVGGPWVDLAAPVVGGPWVDLASPVVGGPWLDIDAPIVGGPWLDIASPVVGGPWLDIEAPIVGWDHHHKLHHTHAGPITSPEQLAASSPGPVTSFSDPWASTAPSPEQSLYEQADILFWQRTKYKVGERLNPADPQDAAMMPAWHAAYADVVAAHAGGAPQVAAWLEMITPYDNPFLAWRASVGTSTYDRPHHVESEAERRRRWPQTQALIESAKREVRDYQAQYPAVAWVWSLDPSGPSTVPGVELGGTTVVTPFSSYAQALDFMRSRIQTPHVALAAFDTASPHWPNPMNWTKSDDPAYEPIIAQRVASGPRVAGAYGGTSIGLAIDDVRARAKALAARRAGDVIGVIHTPKDDHWHSLAFQSEDDADDWLNSATLNQETYTYAAYFNKKDATWPNPVIEKIGGYAKPPIKRPPSQTRRDIIGGALDETRAHAKALATARPGNAAGVVRSVEGLWSAYSFNSLDDAIDWLEL